MVTVAVTVTVMGLTVAVTVTVTVTVTVMVTVMVAVTVTVTVTATVTVMVTVMGLTMAVTARLEALQWEPHLHTSWRHATLDADKSTAICSPHLGNLPDEQSGMSNEQSHLLFFC